MVRPVAENSTSLPPPEVLASPETVTFMEVPRASAIWEATVRCQISSYSLNSSASRTLARAPGVAKRSPAGRIASCASWEFLTLRWYWRGASATYSEPYSSRAWLRAASMPDFDSVIESVRM